MKVNLNVFFFECIFIDYRYLVMCFDVLNDLVWLYNCINMLFKFYNYIGWMVEKINYNIFV